MQYRKDIDGLRSLAIFPVLFYHMGLYPFHAGYLGVDIFFVISGFLISVIISRGIKAGTFSLKNFYRNRILRVFPALCLVFLVSWVASLFLYAPDALGSFSLSLISATIFASNYYFALQDGYTAASSSAELLLHTWSLAIEEQFYIIAPVLAVLIYRIAPGARHLAILSCFIVSIFLAYFIGSEKT